MGQHGLVPDHVERTAALTLSAHRYHAWTHIPTTTDDDEGRASAWPRRQTSRGLSPSPARRWLRRTGALLAGAPLLAGLLQLPAAPSAYAPTGAAAEVAAPARSTSPSTRSAPRALRRATRSPSPARSTNKGKQTITDAHVGLRVGPTLERPLGDRRRRPERHRLRRARTVGGKYVDEVRQAGRRASPQTFSLTVPVDKLRPRRRRRLPARCLAHRAGPPPRRTTRSSASSGPSCRGSPRRRTRRRRTTYLWPLDLHRRT